MTTPKTDIDSAPQAAVPGAAFTDASCYHATLGTLLLEHDGRAEPTTVLGNTAATRARRTQDGPVFGDLVPALIDSMAARGHRVVRGRLADEDGWGGLTAALHAGDPLVVVVDTFHLDHYWLDRGRVHALHALTLRQFNPADGTVRLTDAVDVTFVDNRVPLADLEPALLGSDIGQGWLEVADWGPVAGTVGVGSPKELQVHAAALSGCGGEELSGVELAAYLSDSLDRLFELTPRLARPDARGGADDERRRVTRLMRGMWNYHHTLRWFARYLLALPAADDTRPTAAAVERASQDWLAARSMLLHSGLASPARTARYRDEVARRLGRVAGDLQAAGELLGGGPEVPAWEG
ncbi:cysteine peptidase family C39 domain-containing protein [Kitasatospora sp. NPDC001175]|uniref:hypothetical protein n=1 Tax=Kitasatospora sp. NPDC001175 TaxID=3157103 RepID=UPI003D06E833